MGIPTEMSTDGLHTVVAPTAPTTRITSSHLQGFLKRTRIRHIHQQTVLTTRLNIPRPTIVRGHHWQTTGRGLKQRETKGFSKGRVHKQTASTHRPPIEGRNLSTTVLFRISHLSVEIKPIDEVEHLLEDITLLLLELTRIFPTSQDEHQIVPIPQHW